MRTGEQDGVDYHFLSMEAFNALKDKGELLEWAQVYKNCYGTLRQRFWMPSVQVRAFC